MFSLLSFFSLSHFFSPSLLYFVLLSRMIVSKSYFVHFSSAFSGVDRGWGGGGGIGEVGGGGGSGGS